MMNVSWPLIFLFNDIYGQQVQMMQMIQMSGDCTSTLSFNRKSVKISESGNTRNSNSYDAFFPR